MLISVLSYFDQVGFRKIANIVVGLILTILYVVCAVKLTFDNGPATYAGNHYFSVWAGFFISVSILGSMMKEFFMERARYGTVSAPVADSADKNPGGCGVEENC